jgi:hypothetical protein
MGFICIEERKNVIKLGSINTNSFLFHLSNKSSIHFITDCVFLFRINY